MVELSGGGAEPLSEEDPRRIGVIPLVGRLGAGGMGRVYLGVHQGEYAAVKQVLPSVFAEDPGFLRRFGQELDNLARLPADVTAPLLASDREARPPWLATAYIPRAHAQRGRRGARHALRRRPVVTAARGGGRARRGA
ncbi:hypothetical protein [Streptomyces andamanensis]